MKILAEIGLLYGQLPASPSPQCTASVNIISTFNLWLPSGPKSRKPRSQVYKQCTHLKHLPLQHKNHFNLLIKRSEQIRCDNHRTLPYKRVQLEKLSSQHLHLKSSDETGPFSLWTPEDVLVLVQITDVQIPRHLCPPSCWQLQWRWPFWIHLTT